MTRRNPPAKWVLPTIVNPDTSLCVTIHVPNEPAYKAAFWGALLDLAAGYKWQDDPAHTAKDVAAVWQGIIDDLSLDTCPIEPTAPHGTEIEEDMGIRIDCDCNVWITCCDGTEKQLATVEMVNAPSQPGAGTGGPPPAAGACRTYQGKVSGNGLWYAPFVVNTGDTLNLTSAAGATFNPANVAWYCPDGDQFFAGACVPYPVTDGANPMPGVPSGKLIAKIGGTYYDIQGGVFTVPGGVTNQPLELQFNYANIAASSGDVSFFLEFCNNVAGSFTHTFDFTLTNGGWNVSPVGPGWASGDNGHWTAGAGFQSDLVDYTTASYRLIQINKLLGSAREITNITVFFALTPGTLSGPANNDLIETFVGGSATNQASVNHTTPPSSPWMTGPISAPGVTKLEVLLFGGSQNGSGDPGGSVTITKVVVTGVGTDPF